jgi:hypothetical protein
LAAARFFFMGVPQHIKSIVEQPQSSSKTTTSPQSPQAYLLPAREAFLGAAFLATAFLGAVFLATGFLVVAILLSPCFEI